MNEEQKKNAILKRLKRMITMVKNLRPINNSEPDYGDHQVNLADRIVSKIEEEGW